jgi:tellurite resistance protein TehA-like permease
MFCALSFNVGWWAYVFPVGSAATMTILLSSQYDDNLAMFAFACIGFIATTSLMVLVATLTVRDIVRGQIPKSPDSLQTYLHIQHFNAAMAAETASSVDESELEYPRV